MLGESILIHCCEYPHDAEPINGVGELGVDQAELQCPGWRAEATSDV
jgi:hypothetical protein